MPDTSSDNRRKAVFCFRNPDRFLSNSLTALSWGGFSLDSIQTNFKGEAHGIHEWQWQSPRSRPTRNLSPGRTPPAPESTSDIILRSSAAELSALAERGDRAFLEPLVITQDRTILDGYARLELARRKGRATLPCIEYELSGEDALRWLLQRHRRSNGLNDFCRILI